MDLGIQGQACLVVGGAAGLAMPPPSFWLAKAAVALADIDGAAAAASAQRLATASGAKVVGLKVDVTNHDEVRRLVADTETAIGSLSILINSAAVLDDKLFVDSQPSDWKRMIDVCLYGPMNVIHAVLPGMMTRRYGRIEPRLRFAPGWVRRGFRTTQQRKAESSRSSNRSRRRWDRAA